MKNDKPTTCPWCGSEPEKVWWTTEHGRWYAAWHCDSFKHGRDPWQSDSCRAAEAEQKNGSEYERGRRAGLEEAANLCIDEAERLCAQLASKPFQNPPLEGRMLGWSNASNDIRALADAPSEAEGDKPERRDDEG